MRFCQVDGTPLVDDAPAFDPYATIVAPAGIAVPPVEEAPVAEAPVEASPSTLDESEAATQIAPFPDSAPIAEPSDVLDLPAESDPLKTMYVSEDELKQALGETASVEEDLIELPSVEPDPPAFIEPAVAAPPPSPFDANPVVDEAAIPSPFANNEPVVEIAPEPEVPVFTIPEPTPPPFVEPATAPVFEQPAAAAPMEWTPPPAPDAAWQNQPVGAETPFAPPVAGAAAPSQGLAIGSMVCGILSCLCCISILTGPAGIIMGYMARKKANEDPANYGGATFAMVGMITGVIGFIIGTAALILQVFFGVLSNIR